MKSPVRAIFLVTVGAILCSVAAGLVEVTRDSSSVSTAILVGATFAYAGYTVILVRSAQEQARTSNRQADASEAAALAAVEASNAAVVSAREATRARLNVPAVAVFVEPEFDGPLRNDRLNRRPYANELRLWDQENLHFYKSARPWEFVVDEVVDVWLWFRIRLVIRNVGLFPARIRLQGEMRFVEGTSDMVGSGLPNIPIPPVVGAERNGERLLEPGQASLVDWYDGLEARECAAGQSAMYAVITVIDHGGAVYQYLPVEAGARPLERVPGSNVRWQVVEDPSFGATVHPTLQWFVVEGPDARPRLPWDD